MRYSPRLFRAWTDPIRHLTADEERSLAFQLLSLDLAFKERPMTLRRLSDPSLPVEVRLGWIKEGLPGTVDSPCLSLIAQMLRENGFAKWSTFFHDYLRFRVQTRLGRLYLVKSHTTLSPEEHQRIGSYLEERFSEPASLYPIVDQTLKAGIRLESLDGWVLDASLVGRLTRLASSLV